MHLSIYQSIYLSIHPSIHLAIYLSIYLPTFTCKRFGKRNKLPFFIVHMPYLSTNIPSSVFYDSIVKDLLRIARCSLKLTDCVPTPSQLYTRLVIQSENKTSILHQIKKIIPKIS